MPQVWSQLWMLHPPPHPYCPQSSLGSLELHPPKSLQLLVPQPDVQVAVALALDPEHGCQLREGGEGGKQKGRAREGRRLQVIEGMF
jgi:hypothetical protein